MSATLCHAPHKCRERGPGFASGRDGRFTHHMACPLPECGAVHHITQADLAAHGGPIDFRQKGADKRLAALAARPKPFAIACRSCGKAAMVLHHLS